MKVVMSNSKNKVDACNLTNSYNIIIKSIIYFIYIIYITNFNNYIYLTAKKFLDSTNIVQDKTISILKQK